MNDEHESLPEPTNILQWAAGELRLITLELSWLDDPGLNEACWDLDDAFGPVPDEDDDDE